LPGATVGWGYQLVNTDTLNWFVPTQLNASSFSIGSPDASYFDFPILVPGAAAVVAFDAALHTGLYGVQIFPFALPGQIDSGSFSLSGEWWSGDPLSGGTFLQAADVACRRSRWKWPALPPCRCRAACRCWRWAWFYCGRASAIARKARSSLGLR